MISLSADVGGTFTDVVLADSASGRTFADKVLTTPGTSDAIVAGILRLTGWAGVKPSDIDIFVHGFTIATNVWLTRSGARVVLAVTQGFRDVLEIATQRRGLPYSLTQTRTMPLVPRSRVIEVDERLDAFGGVAAALSEQEAERTVEAILALKPEAVAISLLFSHLNPAHEQLLARALKSRAPDLPVYCSSVINPQIEEYPRTNTTVTAAYVGPAVDEYIRKLETALPAIGMMAPVLLMRSDGGVSTIQAARDNPATMLLSGPAGGVVAGCAISRDHATPNIITFDMGGTSADFSLIAEGAAVTANERLINGEVLRLTTLDIPTISAGGGSIGSVDLGGAIRVGPASAGSVPGPACYGRGGTLPTLTDAALVLGLLDADEYLGGEMRLDTGKAKHAIKAAIADRLSISVEDAAYAMITIANAQMAQAIRSLSVERGHDLREFSLLAFGGAGSIFAPFLAEDLEMRDIVIPSRPGVFSASGLLLSDIRYTFQTPFLAQLDAVDHDALDSAGSGMRELARQAFERDGVAAQDRQIRYLADLRYVGQVHELTLPIEHDNGAIRWNAGQLAEQFSRAHERAYGFADGSIPCEVVNLRLEGVGNVAKPKTENSLSEVRETPVKPGRRSVYLGPALGYREVNVYRRNSLHEGDRLTGPAVINQPDTTIFVLPTQEAQVGRDGVLRIIAIAEEN
ncbi:hydantoinase/oxoprolinase family protein [Mesorhizobium sp. SP-1A]|uniref:hydantoinase/oxoprolinase family protein n=1 Tax=Mesorhizobium sp. SP-1A TaxID=3077840 RepID=UPI0028F6EEB0|nr:hydantoinase/oxoprolinase family protein [Mesorhizobium sp. SP-1A]